MSAADVRIAAARGEAEARRERFVATLEQIKLRLAPKSIAQDAWEGAKDRSTEAAETAIEAVKQRPAVAASVVAGTALFLARRPLFDMISGLFADSDRPGPNPTPKPKKESSDGEARPARARR